MPTGNAIQSPFSSAGTSTLALEAQALVDTTGTVNVGSSAAPAASGSVLISSSTTTATWGALPAGAVSVGTLIDATGSVSVGGATAPGAAGSVLTISQVSAGGTLGVWSTTLGTVGSAGTAGAGTVGSATLSTNAGTATVAGTATISNAIANSASATVNTSGQAAPAAAGSVLTVTQVSAGGTLASWSTTAGTVGSASVTTNAGTATVAGTATIANALTVSGGTVGVSAATAPGAAGSVLVSSSANTATWGTIAPTPQPPLGTAIGTTNNGTAFRSAAAGTTFFDQGPSLTVAANYIGAGTTYKARGYFTGTGSNGAVATSTITVVLSWAGTHGATLATASVISGVSGASFIAGGTNMIDADIFWESTSAAQVNYLFNGTGTLVSTLVTGLTTTSAATLSFTGIAQVFGGGATATATCQTIQAQIWQVH